MRDVEVAGHPAQGCGLESSPTSIVLDEVSLVQDGSRRVDLPYRNVNSRFFSVGYRIEVFDISAYQTSILALNIVSFFSTYRNAKR